MNDHSPGRFITVVQGFLDPAVYAKQREITVTGVVTKSSSAMIGEYKYTFPEVLVNTYILWQPVPEYPRYYPSYLYDPWYYPYYPYGPYYW